MKYSSLKTPSIIFLILILGIVTPIVCASMGSNYGKFRRVEDAVVDTQTGDIAFGYSTGNGFVVEVYSSDGNRLFFKNLNAYGGVIRLCYQDGSLYVKAGRENIRPKFDRSGEVVSYGKNRRVGLLMIRLTVGRKKMVISLSVSVPRFTGIRNPPRSPSVLLAKA